MLDCMEILSIAAARRIRVYAIQEYWRLDDTIQSKLVAMACSMAAEIEALLENGSTQAFIAKCYETTPANLSNWIRKHGITRPRP